MMSAKSGQVREWAVAQGLLEPGSRGRIPRDVTDAFHAEHDGAPQDPAGAPPGREYEPDPAPNRARAGSSAGPARPGPQAAIQRDIAAKTALILGIPVAWWAGRDPCGQVAQEQLPPFTMALADIFMDSPDIVAFFTKSGGAYMKWLALGVTIEPVVRVAFVHHVANRGRDTGEAADYVPPDMSQYHAPAL